MGTGRPRSASGIRGSGSTRRLWRPECAHLAPPRLSRALRSCGRSNPTVRYPPAVSPQPGGGAFSTSSIAAIRHNSYTVGLMEPPQDAAPLPDITFLTQDEVRRLFAVITGKR